MRKNDIEEDILQKHKLIDFKFSKKIIRNFKSVGINVL